MLNIKPRRMAMATKGHVEVYGLRDPRDGLVKYVGIAGDAKHRFSTCHAFGTRHSRATREWFKDMKNSGVSPQVEVLEIVKYEIRALKEKEWSLKFANSLLHMKNENS